MGVRANSSRPQILKFLSDENQGKIDIDINMKDLENMATWMENLYRCCRITSGDEISNPSPGGYEIGHQC